MKKDKPAEEYSFQAALAYIPVIGICCLFAVRPLSKTEQFHARQGFVLFTLEMFLTMVCFVPVIGHALLALLVAGIVILHSLIVWQMYKGHRVRLGFLTGIVRLMES